MLKNHRREQSANATAGRNKAPNSWGDEAIEERRGASYERADRSEEYKIVGESRYQPVTSSEPRSKFVSPSPEPAKKPEVAST